MKIFNRLLKKPKPDSVSQMKPASDYVQSRTPLKLKGKRPEKFKLEPHERVPLPKHLRRMSAEGVNTADKKPEVVKDPETHKTRVRMVPVDKEVIKREGKKFKEMRKEAKDPNEYDNEGSMMKSQLKQICSANEKLMSMVKDDDNLPEWVQSKVTKATDYIRSVRDYLEAENMEEKTLTPAELKKRNDVAKAIKKDDPDMPMDKKMAIATSVAKKTAEAAEYPHPMYDPKSGEKVMAKTPADHNKYAKMGYTHEKPDMKELSMSMKDLSKTGLSKKASSVDKDKLKKDLARLKKGVNEVSSNTLGNYMRKSAAAAAKPGASARTQDKRIGGQKMADNKIRKKMGYSSPAKVPAGANEAHDSEGIKAMKKAGNAKADAERKETQEGKARDRLLKIMNKASGRTMADREKDAAAATARRKEADKDLQSFRQKMGK